MGISRYSQSAPSPLGALDVEVLMAVAHVFRSADKSTHDAIIESNLQCTESLRGLKALLDYPTLIAD